MEVELVINELLVPKLTGVKRCINIETKVKEDWYTNISHTFTFEGSYTNHPSMYVGIRKVLLLIGMTEYLHDYIKLEYE